MGARDLAATRLQQIEFLANPRLGHFIDGTFVLGAQSDWLRVVDPATEETVAEVQDGGPAEIDAAVASARKAFAGSAWRSLRPADREQLLLKLAALIEANADELAAMETLQGGKLFGLARNAEVLGAAQFVRYMAGWATKLHGQTLANSIRSPGSEWFTYTLREPVGVVGAIVPWNFPFAIALWKIAPALAAGCTVVLKPSEETPLTALRLAALAIEAGFPPGVLNVVTGRGATAGAALARHAGVNKLSFTGSTGVGRLIGHAALENMARFTLELGGKSPAIALDDADPASVAQGISRGIFTNQGQVCTASSRLYVHRSIYREVLDRMCALAEAMKIGAGFDSTSQFGPVVSKRHFDRVMGFVDEAKANGAQLVTGGARDGSTGCFIKPTIFSDVDPALRIAREEVFGPVLLVTPFDDVESAIAQANDTPFGLAASIWTRSLSAAHRIVPRLEAGMVWVNSHNVLDHSLPLGGVKQSGYGRDLGAASVESFTELKSVCIAY